MLIVFSLFTYSSSDSRDRIVLSTSRCGRDNPGSNPGHGRNMTNFVEILWVYFNYFVVLLEDKDETPRTTTFIGI